MLIYKMDTMTDPVTIGPDDDWAHIRWTAGDSLIIPDRYLNESLFVTIDIGFGLDDDTDCDPIAKLQIAGRDVPLMYCPPVDGDPGVTHYAAAVRLPWHSGAGIDVKLCAAGSEAVHIYGVTVSLQSPQYCEHCGKWWPAGWCDDVCMLCGEYYPE